MKKHFQKLEFYITNVCNLSCPDCNRFNDHDFRGHQIWADYAHDYQQWSKKISVDQIVILGGEPLLNPNINDWIMGLNQAFGRNVQILTNGTRLNKTPGLYEALCSHNDGQWHNWIGISVHNSNDLDRYFEEARKFLRGPITIYRGKEARHPNGNLISHGADYTFHDVNRVAVRIWIQDSFYNSALQSSQPTNVGGIWKTGALRPFDNDPQEAHESCGFVQWKNYHMIKGRLHKCGPCVLLAEFDRQNSLDISDDDREIMNSYRALSAWDDDEFTNEFYNNLDNVIPQCKFCPTDKQMTKKIIFAKLKKKNSTGTFN